VNYCVDSLSTTGTQIQAAKYVVMLCLTSEASAAREYGRISSASQAAHEESRERSPMSKIRARDRCIRRYPASCILDTALVV
jgi:hypothetical protein